MPPADEAIPQPAQQLDAWLHDRAAFFEAWREETGSLQGWDFSEESLDILETLVRERFSEDVEVRTAKTSSFVQGAVWYVGETVRRNRAASWMFNPRHLAPAGPAPALFEGTRGQQDTPSMSGSVRGGGDGGIYPLGALVELFWEEDDAGERIEPRLRDILDCFD
ncbi:hypothetical protein ACFVW8_29405 [Streptomyces sp. NPDC058221]|uniref:hypothetical protein n=1 Tax=Streptomyces sp. NPDC058221 TaxID=3346388 RepID=UPI0036E0E922